MSLLIKALNKAESSKDGLAQTQNAKTRQSETLQVQTEKKLAKSKPDLSLQTSPAQNSAQYPALKPVLDFDLTPLNKQTVFDASAAKDTIYAPNSTTEITTDLTAKNSQTLINSQTNVNNQPTNSAQAKNAANVFSAKGNDAKTANARLAMIAGFGLIALLAMGLYFYQFVDNTPAIVVPARSIEQTLTAPEVVATTTATLTQQSTQQNIDTQTNRVSTAPQSAIKPANAGVSSAEQAETSFTAAIKKTKKNKAMVENEAMPTMQLADDEAGPPNEPVSNGLKQNELIEEPALVAADEATNGVTNEATGEAQLNDNEDATNRLQASFSANKKTNKTTEKITGKTRKSKNNAAIASESASIQVSKSTPKVGISPTLMAAYEAYNAGNDKDAIKLYKQVLQRDVRNVDALLGLGAIAARQGRSADANGWYDKVLEVDPRNNIAKAAMLDNQSQGNELNNETSLKNMLAKQPNDANLHVALGNLYAEQNQWPAAQQAYFDAYSLNKTADNAYNLAVSLDQMGKPTLALPYYLIALKQLNNASNIDKTALQARIAAIE